jgi:hypothetical protein
MGQKLRIASLAIKLPSFLVLRLFIGTKTTIQTIYGF